MSAESKQVAAWLQPEQIHLDVALRDCDHALEFIAQAIGADHGLDPGVIFRALSRREQAGSTALGGGFAMPHASIPGIELPLTLLVRTREPITFNASDHGPVSLMLAILVPEHGDRNVHLKLLALVAELMSQPGFRARLYLATEPEGVLGPSATRYRRSTPEFSALAVGDRADGRCHGGKTLSPRS